MKPKIELGREYKTRGGGKAVVYRDDGQKPFIFLGAYSKGNDWNTISWYDNGQVFLNGEHHADLILPRTVMVPVEVPEWAVYVRQQSLSWERRLEMTLTFTCDPEEYNAIPIDDWIASLGGEK